jgi:hypothetical protein
MERLPTAKRSVRMCQDGMSPERGTCLKAAICSTQMWQLANYADLDRMFAGCALFNAKAIHVNEMFDDSRLVNSNKLRPVQPT